MDGETVHTQTGNSGLDDLSPGFPVISSGPMKNRTGTIRLHIFDDRRSVEVFGNNRETTISGKIYPGEESLSIRFFSNHGKVKI